MNESSLDNLKSLLPEFYQAIGETLIMVGVSSAVGIIVGGLLGIWLYTTAYGQIFANRPVHRILGTLVSFMRSFPFVILMIVVMPLTRAIVGTSFGPLAASVSLSIAASFYFARLVEQNLKEVPRGVVEAAQAMGASPRTIIFKVLLSEARSGLVLSITILMIAILGESAASGLIGGGGIGRVPGRGSNRILRASTLYGGCDGGGGGAAYRDGGYYSKRRQLAIGEVEQAVTAQQ